MYTYHLIISYIYFQVFFLLVLLKPTDSSGFCVMLMQHFYNL